MLAGALTLGAGVLIGALIVLACLYLGTPKLAALSTAHVPPDPKSRVTPPSEDGAAKPTPKVAIRTMGPYLRAVERNVAKMPEAQVAKIMQKIHNEAY